jgi:hypothetical protein
MATKKAATGKHIQIVTAPARGSKEEEVRGGVEGRVTQHIGSEIYQ